MKIKKNNFFVHAVRMVIKNLKTYMMLSVTVVLSFSVLLGYLVISDSSTYNEYSEIMGADEHIFLCNDTYSKISTSDIEKVTGQLDKMTDTEYYIANKYDDISKPENCTTVYIMPEYVWGVFEIDEYNGIAENKRRTVNGEYSFYIESDEIIVPQAVYEAGEDKEITIEYVGKTGSESKKYKIGGYHDFEENIFMVSINSVKEIELNVSNFQMCIYSEHVETVAELLTRNDFAHVNTGQDVERAQIEKKAATNTKYTIGMVLFILLGINLYSAFENALSDRKFEIGVKRAIGAGKKDIMLQFLTEGLMVMIVNIIISMVIVMNVMLSYKLFNRTYTIVFNGYSMILFFVCTISLSVLFSMIFAYKTTEIEVIKYLKEE